MVHKVLLFSKGTFFRINIQNKCVRLEFTPNGHQESNLIEMSKRTYITVIWEEVISKFIEKGVRRLSEIL
jgi:hypothetical protein